MNTQQIFNNGLALSLSILIASIALAGSAIFYTIIQAETTAAANDNQAVQLCLELAKGTRTTSGSTDSEDWRLEQVDINYEVVTKCLQEKNAQ